MFGVDRKKVVGWIRGQLGTGTETRHLCRLFLRHAQAGKSTAPVDEWGVAEESPADELASLICAAANADAEGLGGLQQYVVTAHFSDDPDRVRARYSFRILIETGDEDSAGPTESPTKDGMLAQMMRHNEVIMRTSMMGIGETQRIQSGMISRFATQIETLQDKHIAMLELHEKLVLATDDREIRKVEITSKISREDQAMDKVMMLAPVIVNRLMGNKVLAEKMTPQEMMIESFMQSFTPEQFQGVLATLRSDQQIMVMEMYEASRKAKEAREKKPELPAKTGNGNLTEKKD